jgi:hypothetical protein
MVRKRARLGGSRPTQIKKPGEGSDGLGQWGGESYREIQKMNAWEEKKQDREPF